MIGSVLEIHREMMWLAQYAIRDMLQHLELQMPQLMVLTMLGGLHPELGTPSPDGLSMRDFTRALSLPPATATSLIDRMTARGLVERTSSPQDRRVVVVRLTPQGQDVLQQVNRAWQRTQEDVFGTLDDQDLQQYLAIVQRLRDGYHQRYPQLGRELAAAPCGAQARGEEQP